MLVSPSHSVCVTFRICRVWCDLGFSVEINKRNGRTVNGQPVNLQRLGWESPNPQKSHFRSADLHILWWNIQYFQFNYATADWECGRISRLINKLWLFLKAPPKVSSFGSMLWFKKKQTIIVKKERFGWTSQSLHRCRATDIRQFWRRCLQSTTARLKKLILNFKL